MKAAVQSCMWLYATFVLIPHTRNYASLLALVEDLGCDYFKVLKAGHNATYTSPEIVAGFLAADVKESVVKSVAKYESFTVMCDESTDIGVLKHLEPYARAIPEYVTRESAKHISYLCLTFWMGKQKSLSMR